MKKITLIASASLLVIAGNAVAEQALTEAQMDGVSAGAIVALQGAAGSDAWGGVIGNLLNTTYSNTYAAADPQGQLANTITTPNGSTVNPGDFYAYGIGSNTSIATSVFNPGAGIGGAMASSTSSAASALY